MQASGRQRTYLKKLERALREEREKRARLEKEVIEVQRQN